MDNVLTPADVAIYGALHPTIVRPGETWVLPELTPISRRSLNGSQLSITLTLPSRVTSITSKTDLPFAPLPKSFHPPSPS